MPRGGYRPGAGRPRKKDSERRKQQRLELEVPTPEGKQPLRYMLEIMNDPNADPERRDRMAIAAAPFVHAKPAPDGKKGRKAASARDAAESGRFAQAEAPPGVSH